MSPGRPQTSDKLESELDDVSPWSDGADDVPSDPSSGGSGDSGGGHHSIDDEAVPHVPAARSGGDD
jgi:molybdopterin-containing oxidoreductase family iron-sulfur binding subunit